MKRGWTSLLVSVAILLAVSSCSSVPKGPLERGEMRLLSLEVPDNGNLKLNIAYQVTLKFEADGRPEVRRVCFMPQGENLLCTRPKDVEYGSEASLGALYHASPGHRLVECYVEYVRDGKVRRTNTVSSYVMGM